MLHVAVRRYRIAPTAAALMAVLLAGLGCAGRNGAGADAGRSAEKVALPCILSFRMAGCAPCERTAPAVAAVKASRAGAVRVESIDIGRRPELGRRFGVAAVPALVLFDSSGREIARRQGAMTREEIEALVRGSKLTAGGVRPAGSDRSLEALLALLSVGPESGGAGAAALVPDSGLVVFYFHGEFRSGCSQGLEDASREALDGMAKAAPGGRELAWRTIDIEAAENARWAKAFGIRLADHDLSRGIIVLARMRDGKPARWKPIGDLVSHRFDLEELKSYVVEQAGDFLKPNPEK